VVLGAALRMLPLEGAHTTASAPPASIAASVE
jgi:hypothetical protein